MKIRIKFFTMLIGLSLASGVLAHDGALESPVPAWPCSELCIGRLVIEQYGPELLAMEAVRNVKFGFQADETCVDQSALPHMRHPTRDLCLQVEVADMAGIDALMEKLGPHPTRGGLPIFFFVSNPLPGVIISN